MPYYIISENKQIYKNTNNKQTNKQTGTPTFFTASISLALISGSVTFALGVGGVLGDLSPLPLGVFSYKEH